METCIIKKSLNYNKPEYEMFNYPSIISLQQKREEIKFLKMIPKKSWNLILNEKNIY